MLGSDGEEAHKPTMKRLTLEVNMHSLPAMKLKG
jgi:hypothetical protein